MTKNKKNDTVKWMNWFFYMKYLYLNEWNHSCYWQKIGKKSVLMNENAKKWADQFFIGKLTFYILFNRTFMKLTSKSTFFIILMQGFSHVFTSTIYIVRIWKQKKIFFINFNIIYFILFTCASQIWNIITV